MKSKALADRIKSIERDDEASTLDASVAGSAPRTRLPRRMSLRSIRVDLGFRPSQPGRSDAISRSLHHQKPYVKSRFASSHENESTPLQFTLQRRRSLDLNKPSYADGFSASAHAFHRRLPARTNSSDTAQTEGSYGDDSDEWNDDSDGFASENYAGNSGVEAASECSNSREEDEDEDEKDDDIDASNEGRGIVVDTLATMSLDFCRSNHTLARSKSIRSKSTHRRHVPRRVSMSMPRRLSSPTSDPTRCAKQQDSRRLRTALCADATSRVQRCIRFDEDANQYHVGWQVSSKREIKARWYSEKDLARIKTGVKRHVNNMVRNLEATRNNHKAWWHCLVRCLRDFENAEEKHQVRQIMACNKADIPLQAVGLERWILRFEQRNRMEAKKNILRCIREVQHAPTNVDHLAAPSAREKYTAETRARRIASASRMHSRPYRLYAYHIALLPVCEENGILHAKRHRMIRGPGDRRQRRWSLFG